MVATFNVPPRDVAFWAGLSTAIFSLAQCLTGIFWGRLSDRVGRKYVVLWGLGNTAVMALLFGSSTGFGRNKVGLGVAMAARAMAGAGNGSVGILRTMVAEMCPWKELQPRAFSVMPLVWNVGSVIGPILGKYIKEVDLEHGLIDSFINVGGTLSNPLNIDPLEPPGKSFLEIFPYALPNIVSACLFFVGIVIGFLFLEETLESKKGNLDIGLVLGKNLTRASSSTFSNCFTFSASSSKWKRKTFAEDNENQPLLIKASDNELNNDARPGVKPSSISPPSLSSVLTPQSLLNLSSYTLLSIYSIGYDALLPIFLHHPRYGQSILPSQPPFLFNKGLGLPTRRIGILFTAYGAFGMIIQFLLFPPLARRFGVLKCLQVSNAVLPIVFATTPFVTLLSTDSSRQIGIIVIMLAKCLASTFMFPCTTILLTNSASSLRVLGTLNGVATSVAAAGRAAGPAVGGVMFSLGVRTNCVGIPFWIFAVVAALGLVPAWWLVDGEGFGSDSDEDEQEDNDENEDSESRERLGIENSNHSSTIARTLDVPTSSSTFGNETLEQEMSYGSPGQLGSKLYRVSTNTSCGASVAVTEQSEEEEDEGDMQHHTSKKNQKGRSRSMSRLARTRIRRRSSVPLGGGVGFRRLSSSLGESLGYEAGEQYR
jgi:MFS family permease